VSAAIGSGGIKPVAALPVLAALERRGLAPQAFAGCSGGGVIAALCAAGHSARQARAIVERLLRRELFARLDLRGLLGVLGCRLAERPGLIRPDAILAMYRDVFGARRIEELPLPLVLQATDLDSGEEVVMASGPVAEALYASTAAYPLLPPIRRDGRWLADGAFSRLVPQAPDADLRIAVISSGPGPALLDALGFAFPASEEVDDDVLVARIDIDRPVRWWDVHLLPALFAAGEQAAGELGRRLPELADRAA
jgi:NTE family protein